MRGFIIPIISFKTDFKTGRLNDKNNLREQIIALIHINWLSGRYINPKSETFEIVLGQSEAFVLKITLKKNSVRACAPLEHEFECVRLWSMWRKGQSEAFVLKITLKKNSVRACAPLEHEFEFEGEEILLLHTRKKRVSVGLSVRIISSFTPEKTEWVWVWVWGYFPPSHPKNRVSVGLSVCASGACEEKDRVKRSYSNPQKNSVSLSLRVKKNQIVEIRALKHKK